MSSSNNSAVRFKEPPVTSVSLVVFFEPVEGLMTSHLSSIREKWRGKYPRVSERPPLPPRGMGENRLELLPLDEWAFPYTTFYDESRENAVAIQNDRFVQSWSFAPNEDSDSEAYPGFDSIRSDLEKGFSEFCSLVKAELSIDVIPTGSECAYHNHLGVRMPIEQAIAGFANKWLNVPEAAPTSRAIHGTATIHLQVPEYADECSVALHLHVDDDQEVTLSIRSTYSVEPDDEEEQGSLGGINIAHEQLINSFIEYTSQQMQERWGRI